VELKLGSSSSPSRRSIAGNQLIGFHARLAHFERPLLGEDKINVYPAAPNSSGIRWEASLPGGDRLRADTKAGMRDLISVGLVRRRLRGA
jgi:hypothetical protein